MYLFIDLYRFLIQLTIEFYRSLSIMHLSLETPTPSTPGRRGAYVGICKSLDDLPAPRGWENSSLN